MHILISIITLSTTLVFGQPADAKPLDVSQPDHQAIGDYASVLKENAAPLALDAALQAYKDGQFYRSKEAVLSLGIGASPVWVAFEISNPLASPVTRRLSINNSWIDKIDVYFLRQGQTQSAYHTGDAQMFSERPIDNRLFLFDHSFPPGITTLLIRTETPDPMLLPIYLSSIEQTNTRQQLNSYSYGFLYGGIFVLLAYNLMLFFSLKSYRYLYYSFYLAAFLGANIAYTGHGFMWLWPDSPRWQLWSNPVLMMLFAVSGLLFATLFLNTRMAFPRIHRGIMSGIIGFAALLTFAIAIGSQVSALLLAFFFIFVFSVGMVFLGIISLRAGNKSAKYFLAASVTHVSASSITAMVVSGFIPYSVLAFRAVDIGMMIDAILLAMALADQFRINREAKIQAEKLAKVDPLTGINNRRAFYELVKPIRNTGLRHDHDMSIILMDIDKFKSINDNYGHMHGDNVLTLLATTLKNEVRSGDILARWGGEEFIVFLPETSHAEALILADRFRQTIASLRPQIDNQNISLTISMGVAHQNKTDITLDQLISNADRQLYSAKEMGRNRVC